MKICVKVIPNARKSFFDGERIYVKAKAEDGKANLAVIEIVADYYGVKKSAVKIVSGLKSRRKTLEILP